MFDVKLLDVHDPNEPNSCMQHVYSTMNLFPLPAILIIDLLQVSLSLSYIIECTLHDVVRRGGARKRDLSTSENLGSKLNRKCKTCFNSINCFLSVFICIDLAQCK